MSDNNKDRKHHSLGWIPDTPDFRDHIYSSPPSLLVEGLPSTVDLRKDHKDTDGSCGPDKDKDSNIPSYIFDQLSTNSCVGNSVSMAIETGLMIQESLPYYTPSRLFIYYNARKMIGQEDIDEGCVIRDAIKSVNKQGVVPEKIWPFDVKKVTVSPTTDLYDIALAHQVLEYKRIPRSLEQFKACLAEGFPFVFGFAVYGSFYSKETTEKGIAVLPGPHEQFLGGHSVLAVGYNDTSREFICINSWGKNWGNKGSFTMPYDYLLNEMLSDDFWQIINVEE